MVESRGRDRFMAQARLDRDKTQADSSPWTNHFRGLSRLGLESGLARGNTNLSSRRRPYGPLPSVHTFIPILHDYFECEIKLAGTAYLL